MTHYLIRRTADKEPLALVKINSPIGGMSIGTPIPSRFGMMAPVIRVDGGGRERHVFNLLIGDNPEITDALTLFGTYRLEEVVQAEWETFSALGLFPVLKLAMAR